MSDWKNKLYYGDNLPVLRDYIADQFVDLVTPFNLCLSQINQTA